MVDVDGDGVPVGVMTLGVGVRIMGVCEGSAVGGALYGTV